MFVKFWMGKEEITLDFTGMTREEIQREFIEWLIERADAGWKVAEEKKDKLPTIDEICEEDLIPFDGKPSRSDDYLTELWSE